MDYSCSSCALSLKIMYSMLFLGIVGAGGVFAGTNPAYKPYELRHHIKTAETKFIIVEPELLGDVLTAARPEGIPNDRIFIFDTRGQSVPSSFRSWEWLLSRGEEDWIRFNDLERAKNTTVARLTTSGMTGLPKTAMQSLYNATLWSMFMTENNLPPFEPRHLLPLPMFHVAAIPAAHATPFRTGNVVYIMRRFELEHFLAPIECHGINQLGIVPPLVISIIISPLTKKYSLKSIKKVACGAAPLDKDSQARFKALCGEGALFTPVLGITEMTRAISLFYYSENDWTGSVGRFMPYTDVKLINDAGEDITGYNVQGELCVRGPTVISGYFNNPKANAEPYDEEGYFKTGDIIYCDSKTKLWYTVDRKKELIKVRGFQAAPIELEGVLLSHPNIVDAAVIGVRNPSTPSGSSPSTSTKETENEHPRAYIVRRPESSHQVTEEEVKAFIAETLASYKQLTGGVRFLNKVPKSASGKILKRVLREEAGIELKRDKARL